MKSMSVRPFAWVKLFAAFFLASPQVQVPAQVGATGDAKFGQAMCYIVIQPEGSDEAYAVFLRKMA